jgi:RimJ/RimL family protein N-acetyltransferase
MNRPPNESKLSDHFRSEKAHEDWRVRDYRPDVDAPVIFQWIRTEQELLHVSPSNNGPLTIEQIRDWVRPGGRGYVHTHVSSDRPIAYGEIVPLHDRLTHRWLGHVIVDPARRGRGFGTEWTKRLIELAFADEQTINVSLVVFPENGAAISAYRRAGMSITGEETHRFGTPTSIHKLIRLELTRDEWALSRSY